MREPKDIPVSLTPGAQTLVELAVEKQKQGNHEHLGVHHWLLALLERHGRMAEAMAHGLVAATLRRQVSRQLGNGDCGELLDKETVIEKALERARQRGKERASERDLAAVILEAAGFSLLDQSTPAMPVSAHHASAGKGDRSRPRPKRPIPTLQQFGRDLTREAEQGKLPSIVGRKEEIELVIETLCRRTKRNPVLVGPAGVGKTAIVEGLARRVIGGQVPKVLRGVRIFGLQPSVLVAGAKFSGELEKRVNALIAEASQDGIVLFIDEVHTIIGAGGAPGSSDVASLLKPALARGEIACIAATTDDEYRRFIELDAALERRFQPVRIQELTAKQTLKVLRALRDELANLRNVHVADSVLKWLIDFARRYLRNRFFPDKAVDLLEQCVAYAVTRGKQSLDEADAQAVAQRMVGMPLSVTTGLASLKRSLSERVLLNEEDAAALVSRLKVTRRALDLNPARPDAVVLLLGDVATNGAALAGTLAESLFGAPERVVTIDFSRFTQAHDITMLIGAPPGYVGYSESLPLHRVVQMPWCVLHCENVHSCHPQIRRVLAQALADGVLTDARGKHIYLSDTVVLLTAAIYPESRGKLGFGQPQELDDGVVPDLVARELGAEFAAQVDLVCTRAPSSEEAKRRWLRHHLLEDLADRYRKQGLDISWDDSVIDWLLAKRSAFESQPGWERYVEELLGGQLLRHLPEDASKPVKTVTVTCKTGRIRVEKRTNE